MIHSVVYNKSLGVTEALSVFCEESGFSKESGFPPVVLCGDFNSLPRMTMDYKGSHVSGLFELFQCGK